MKENNQGNKNGVLVVLIVLLLIMVSVGSIMVGNRLAKRNTDEGNNENIVNKDNDNISIEKIVNDSQEMLDKEKSEFLDKILGDYLSYDGSGIYIEHDNDKYTFVNYMLNTELRPSGIITKVSKYNNKYILTVYFEKVENVAYVYEEKTINVVIDIDKLSNDKIVEIGVVNNGVVNEVNREYIKFNGDFTDWSKKKEFIEGNTTNK